jgi:hypothetical protein
MIPATTSPTTSARSATSIRPRGLAGYGSPIAAPDFYLTAADREEQRDETLTTASRIFLALMKHDPSAKALLLAMPDVFPWVHHLSTEEVRAFTVELVDALSDAAELDLDTNAQEVITGWRATARIKADRPQYEVALRPTAGDFGQVEVTP